jgi:hypothetical protein
VISPADPVALVGCGHEGVELGPGQVGDFGPRAAFRRDGQDLRDEPGMLGMAQRRVVEEGVDGGQAGVPGAGAVVPLLLQMVQEGADDRGAEVGQVQLGGLLAGPGMDEAQQEPPGVAVGGHRVRAGMTLADQPFGEKCLKGRGERAHARLPGIRSRRSAASASSSGTAETYQYVPAGSACPR